MTCRLFRHICVKRYIGIERILTNSISPYCHRVNISSFVSYSNLVASGSRSLRVVSFFTCMNILQGVFNDVLYVLVCSMVVTTY